MLTVAFTLGQAYFSRKFFYLQLAYTWLKHICCIAHSRALVHVIFSSPERHIWTLLPPLDFSELVSLYTVTPQPLLSHPA